MYFKECPKNQCGELDNEKISQIEDFYNKKYKTFPHCQLLVDFVCRVDKTFLSLLAAGLTSYSINIITSFISFDHGSDALGGFYGTVSSLFALSFTVFTWLFTAKVIAVHDQSEHNLLTITRPVSKKFLNKARDNLRFYECYKNQVKIICYMLLGVLFLILSVLCLIFKSACINFFSALSSGFNRANGAIDEEAVCSIFGGMRL